MEIWTAKGYPNHNERYPPLEWRHWQTLLAGFLAFVAGVGTVATLISDTILARSGRNV